MAPRQLARPRHLLLHSEPNLVYTVVYAKLVFFCKIHYYLLSA